MKTWCNTLSDAYRGCSPMPAPRTTHVMQRRCGTSSIGLREFPEIDPEIRVLCDDMLARLDADYQAALADEPVAAD